MRSISNLDDPQHDDPKQRIAAAGNGSNLVRSESCTLLKQIIHSMGFSTNKLRTYEVQVRSAGSRWRPWGRPSNPTPV